MFPSVAPDEMAFAMTLFVGAANGQTQAGSYATDQADQLSGQKFFLALADPQPHARQEVLDSTIFRAFRALWLQYWADDRRPSIAARVLGFCFLMERTRGTILRTVEPLAAPTEALVVLHPAVVEAISTVPLSPTGVLSIATFTSTLEQIAFNYPDLRLRRQDEGPASPQAAIPQSWPAGTGEIATLMRTLDWAKHEMGLPSTWPQSLRTSVELTLASSFPMIVLWGKDLIQFYNDAYRNIMGVKHPGGLGQSTAECWPEVWEFNREVYARVLEGESLTFEDQLFPITRYGYLEDTYFTLCYSPLRLESGAIHGVFVTVFETTRRVLAAVK